jgi:probable rRNA maturation factor
VPIYFRNATRRHRLSQRGLVATSRALLAAAGYADASLSLSFVGDAAIRRLNREHRGKDRPTDVLSFPLYPPFAAPKPRSGAAAEEVLLGDIVISVDTAWRQSRAYDAPLAREIERLLIHGILHLLGHDHEIELERKRMVRAEKRLARAIAMPWPYLDLEGSH